eukprot:jgi/Mesen1/6680/ME000343S05852
MASLQSAMSSLALGGYASSSVFGAPVQSGTQTLRTPTTAPSVICMVQKRWETIKVKPNGLPVKLKLHVKVGDTVQVIAGSDKGKVTEVVQVFSHNSKILCKDINIKTKHVKGKAEGETGQIVQVEAPIHSSNVMLYSKAEKVTSRVGHKLAENGKKVRYLLKTGEIIDSDEEWRKRKEAKAKKAQKD